MRILVFFFILFISKLYGQDVDNVLHVKAIAASEQSAHARLINSPVHSATGASNNFDVKYYRCQWQVDPAVRYINGQITVYYTIITATSTISFDLINGLITDSAKQRNTILEKLHSNNVLQITFANNIAAGTLDSITI